MDAKLKQLKDETGKYCVSIIMNTHRTKPDYDKDPKVLKNHIKEAKERLLEAYDKRELSSVLHHLDQIEEQIDHSHNLESLIVFADEHKAEFLRLPIEVTDRVVIDTSFATRDLVRALHKETNYYVLVLSQREVRLIEAFNDKVVEEIGGEFPFENTSLYSTTKDELANAGRQTQLVAEFFNRVDKALNKVRKDNPLPVLICTEEANYHEYLKIADDKKSILDTYLNKNRLDEKAQAIVAEAWPLVSEKMEAQRKARKEDLSKAVGAGNFLSDLSDIWKAIGEGRVDTLFIEEELFAPAIIKNQEIHLVDVEKVGKQDVIDDIYDEMIEANLNFGGDVVFLPKGELEKFHGIAAKTRY